MVATLLRSYVLGTKPKQHLENGIRIKDINRSRMTTVSHICGCCDMVGFKVSLVKDSLKLMLHHAFGNFSVARKSDTKNYEFR